MQALLLYDVDTSFKVTYDLAYNHFNIMHGAFYLYVWASPWDIGTCNAYLFMSYVKHTCIVM